MRNNTKNSLMIPIAGCLLLSLTLLVSAWIGIRARSERLEEAAAANLALAAENTNLKGQLEMLQAASDKAQEVMAERRDMLAPYLEALAEDERVPDIQHPALHVDNGVVTFQGQSFQEEDPLQVDDAYDALLMKFYKLYDLMKADIPEEVLRDAGFDPWFVNAYGFAPFIDLHCHAALISREYLYVRTQLELAIRAYTDGELDKQALDAAFRNFERVRAQATEILAGAASADI